MEIKDFEGNRDLNLPVLFLLPMIKEMIRLAKKPGEL